MYHGKGIDETLVFFHHDYFDELMGEKHNQAESLAIAEMFGRLSPSLRKWARDRISESKLHPSVVAALTKKLTADDE